MLSKHVPHSLHISKIIVIILLVVSFFGFYVVDIGLRTSHLVLYPLFFVSLIIHLFQKGSFLVFSGLRHLVFLWVSLLIWYYLATIFNGGDFSFVRILAITDNIITPVIIIIIITALFYGISIQGIQKSIYRVCKLIIFLLAINTILILINFYWDISSFLIFFQPAADIARGTTVWERSVSMGRQIGIFVAPFESGISYSFGVFCWLYLAKTEKSHTIYNYIVLGLMVIGGIFSISKAFIYALPLFAFFLIINIKQLTNIINYRFLIMIAILSLLYAYLSEFWEGAKLFARYISLDQLTLAILSGNRYGNNDFGVIQKMTFVLNQSPIFGVGIGRGYGAVNPTVIDNAYLEVFWIGGLVGLLIYLLIVVELLRPGFVNFQNNEEARLLLFLVVLVVLAGLGGPVFTLNNFSVMFWVLSTLLLISINLKNKSKKNI